MLHDTRDAYTKVRCEFGWLSKGDEYGEHFRNQLLAVHW